MTAATHRLVVFTGGLSYSVRHGVVEIDSAIPGIEWLVVLHQPPRRLPRLLTSQWRNIRRNGWRWIPYQMQDLWQRVAVPPAPPVPQSCPGADLTLDALLARPNLRLFRADDIHGAESLAQVRDFAPDLGLSLAAPILRAPLFGIPRLGTINLHKGKLPQFRGMPPAFWELWHDQTEVGCSVHRVDDKLDTGYLIAESRVPRARCSTVRGLQLRLDEEGVTLMRGAVRNLQAGHCAARAQPSQGGKTHRKPTLAQVAQLERRLAQAAAGSAGNPVKQAAKELYCGLAWRTGRAATRLGGTARRITVLLYHRVSDEARDNLTVGVEQFDRQMQLLRRHCDLLSLDEVLQARSVARSTRPQVAVTFDDGYLDNYENAAPILRRHGVPAAFFVSTGIVSCQGRFPHDLRRGNPPIPTMSWDQLREMRRWGFAVGSHTVNHIDCAAEPEATVRDELMTSRADLERELGLEEVALAYPYGGRQDMTPTRLQLVREAGYAGCLSAYGGSNIGSVEPFNVLRRGIHWEFSDRAFLVQCLGLR